MKVLRRLAFIVCVVAAVLAQRSGEPLLFGLAAMVALANLVSSQLVCALDGCGSHEHARSFRDPAHLASLINRTTGVIGAILLTYGVADLYSKGG